MVNPDPVVPGGTVMAPDWATPLELVIPELVPTTVAPDDRTKKTVFCGSGVPFEVSVAVAWSAPRVIGDGADRARLVGAWATWKVPAADTGASWPPPANVAVRG